MFLKKQKEGVECRYCKYVIESDGSYACRRGGQVSSAGTCRRYRFDPFAKRVYRRRNLDTSVFDPLDFEI